MTKGCHTCLQLISPEAPMYNFGHTSIENSSSSTITIKDKLLDCIPELLLDSADNGVICQACFTSLRLAYNFKQKCLEAQDKIYGYLQQMPIDTSIDIGQIAIYYNRLELISAGMEPTSSLKPDVIEISDSDDDAQTHDVKEVDFMHRMSPSVFEDISDDDEYEDITDDEEILIVGLNTKFSNSKSKSTDTKTNKVKSPILKVDLNTKSSNSKSKSTDTKTNKVQPPISKVDLTTKLTNSKSINTDTKTNKVRPPMLKADLDTKSSNSKSKSTDINTTEVKKENATKSPYQCRLCTYSCTLACVFQYHMIVIHYDKSSDDEYRCKELNCYFTCSLSCRLLDHLASHTNEQPYACVECSFSTQLAKVIISHSKLHKQPLCQWKYPEQTPFRETASENQAQDLVVEKSTEDLLIFKCTLCTLRCESAHELISHMYTNHSVKVWQ